jgi:actin-related protein 10
VQQWERRLYDVVHLVFFHYLKIDPDTCTVLLLTAEEWSEEFTTALTLVFKRLQAPAPRFLPASLVAVYTNRSESGLVVDLGSVETRISPVYLGFLVREAVVTLPLGFQLIQQQLRRAVEQDYKRRGLLAVVQGLSARDWRTVAKKVAVSALLRENGEEKQLPDQALLTVRAPSGVTVQVQPEDARACCECLFDTTVVEVSLGPAIVAVLQKTPVDLRKSVVANVLVIGGVAHVPNLALRCHQEILHALRGSSLRALVQSVNFGRVVTPSVTSWQGGSLAAGNL